MLLIFLVAVALAFDFLNGLHDAANSIATIVSTKVLSPRYAVAWAAFFNFIAFLVFGLKVAATIGSGIISPDAINDQVVFGALMGAISWNLTAGYLGIPQAVRMPLSADWSVRASRMSACARWCWAGVGKTVVAIVLSPITGLLIALLLMLGVSWAFVRSASQRRWTESSARCSSSRPRPTRWAMAAQRRAEDDGHRSPRYWPHTDNCLGPFHTHPALGCDHLQWRDGAGHARLAAGRSCVRWVRESPASRPCRASVRKRRALSHCSWRQVLASRFRRRRQSQLPSLASAPWASRTSAVRWGVAQETFLSHG